MWRFRVPIRDEFDSAEEYEENLAAYEAAYDDYCDMVEEAWREERDRQSIGQDMHHDKFCFGDLCVGTV